SVTPSKTRESTTVRSPDGSGSTPASSRNRWPEHGSSGSKRFHASPNSPRSAPTGSQPGERRGRLGEGGPQPHLGTFASHRLTSTHHPMAQISQRSPGRATAETYP